MKRKLGQLLLERGWITPEGLEEALRRQLVYQSRIGTLLVLLDQLRLEGVGWGLSVQHGVPQAEASWLQKVPRGILNLVPRELCQKLRLFPFRLEGDAVVLAMRDPQRHVAGEVSYAIGRPVLRCVVPELRLMYCLELHYGIAREPRFLRGPPQHAHQAVERRRYIETVAPAGAPASQAPPDRWAEEHRLIWLDEYQAPPEPAAPAVEEDIDLSDLEEPEAPVNVASRLDLALQHLDSAQNAGEVAQQLAQPPWDDISLSVLFWVRDEVAVAYRAWGPALTPARLNRLAVPLRVNSMLRFAFQRHNAVSGEAQIDPLQAKIADFLGAEPPGQSCVASVVLQGRVVSLWCLQTPAGVDFAPDMLQEVRRVAERAAAAYRRLGAQQV